MPENLISIAIATHNRLDDLLLTLEKLSGYQGQYRELMVCADGCTDGTQSCLREKYPEIRLFENSPGRGSIPSRNLMIRSANTPFILLLDDDSYPMEPDFLDVATKAMRNFPMIGALTFPQRSDEFPESLSCDNFGPNLRVATFTSSGTVIRKQPFLELNGFPDFFFHAYEEPDYSLRLYAAGYKVVQWNELTVRHHFTNTMRNEGRTHRRHARNEFWSTLMRAPARLVLPMLMYRIYSQARYALKRDWNWFIREPLWWFMACNGIPQAWKSRCPVPADVYRNWLALLKEPALFSNGR